MVHGGSMFLGRSVGQEFSLSSKMSSRKVESFFGWLTVFCRDLGCPVVVFVCLVSGGFIGGFM